MALHLDPGHEEIASVMARLFPGKSVKDIMASRAAAQARGVLEQITQGGAPGKLLPLQHE